MALEPAEDPLEARFPDRDVRPSPNEDSLKLYVKYIVLAAQTITAIGLQRVNHRAGGPFCARVESNVTATHDNR